MRVLLSTCGSRGDVEPLAVLAVRLRALGAEVRLCAPPDEEFAQRLAGAGVTPETRAQATAVAGTIRTGGATGATTLSAGAISREGPPVPA